MTSSTPAGALTGKPTAAAPQRAWLRFGLGLLLTAAALAWILSRIELSRVAAAVRDANFLFLAMVPAAVALERFLRALKWKQLLDELRPVGLVRVFGAVMAGHFVAVLVPLGVGAVVRAWLIARTQSLRFTAVFGTIAIDRVMDGLVFVGIIIVVLALVPLPADTPGLRTGLTLAAMLGAILLPLLLWTLVRHHRRKREDLHHRSALLDRLPRKLADRLQGVVRSFAEGTLWPRSPWRRGVLVVASVLMKLADALQWLLSSLAVGILLPLPAYLLIQVVFGTTTVLARSMRLVAGAALSIFVLGLFGVPAEQALVMALLIDVSDILVCSTGGIIALWRSGIGWAELRALRGVSATELDAAASAPAR